MAKKFKGKYPGPDKFKGNKKKIAAWKAAKRKASTPAAPAAPKPPSAASTAAAADTSTAGGQQNAYPSSNVATNSSGTIQLQTNADIEGAVLEAEEELKQAESEATELEQQAEITKAVQEESSRIAANEARGRTNAVNAYRGMRGTSALRKKSEVETENNLRNSSIAEQHRQARENARLHREGARGRRTSVGAWAERARQEYTNERSKDNPTAGSQAVDSGLRPTAPGSEGTTKATAPSLVKTTPKPANKFKGKYPGPDRFKGNKKKIAAWKAAKRKAAK